MRWVGQTDIGLVRKNNEDSFAGKLLDQKLGTEQLLLCIVADGMGGRFAGEVASSMAVEDIQKYMRENLPAQVSEEDLASHIIKAISKANETVYRKAQENEDCQGMGTTLSLIMAAENKLFIGHVGDSRIYRIDNDGITKLTEDHSLVAELVKKGTIKPEEAESHPQKNIITRALGTELELEVDVLAAELYDNDKILLCSDGLTNMVQDNQIHDILMQSPDLETACSELIGAAKKNGGFDNITVVIMQNSRGGGYSDR